MRKRDIRGFWKSGMVAFLALFSACMAAPLTPAQLPDTEHETVLITFHVQKRHEEDMKKTLAEAWQAYRRLDMVLPQTHVILQGNENGSPYFVEILTWEDHDIPDHMPPK